MSHRRSDEVLPPVVPVDPHILLLKPFKEIHFSSFFLLFLCLLGIEAHLYSALKAFATQPLLDVGGHVFPVLLESYGSDETETLAH